MPLSTSPSEFRRIIQMLLPLSSKHARFTELALSSGIGQSRLNHLILLNHSIVSKSERRFGEPYGGSWVNDGHLYPEGSVSHLGLDHGIPAWLQLESVKKSRSEKRCPGHELENPSKGIPTSQHPGPPKYRGDDCVVITRLPSEDLKIPFGH
jgi:hypothetical protein